MDKIAGTNRDNRKLAFSGYTIPIWDKEVLDMDRGDGRLQREFS